MTPAYPKPIRVSLAELVRRRWPHLDASAAERAIATGAVTVEGRSVTNPRSMVPTGASMRLRDAPLLQGHRKLDWALTHLPVDVDGRTALDVGACTGGFTSALLAAGARRVYAVDVGFGQLLGSLRQDSRVVNLERTNVSRLDVGLIGEPLDVITIDVSYLSLSRAVAQLGGLAFAKGVDLVGLVKPMFELRLATIPEDRATLDQARQAASDGVTSAGWTVRNSLECPVHGHQGAVEFFIHASR